MITHTLAAVVAVLALTGCATNDYALYSKAQSDIETSRHNADAAKYKAMSEIAASGSEAAKVAAVMAMAIGQGASGKGSALQAPQASTALQWASVLVPGLTQIAVMGFNTKAQIAQSNNAAAVAISTNGAFVGIAGQIQAPAANITTTTTTTATTTTDRHDIVNTTDSYNTTDRHDIINPAPVVVVTPVVILP